jgi:RNA polymerase sigma-70 factor, ECF subfamily
MPRRAIISLKLSAADDCPNNKEDPGLSDDDRDLVEKAIAGDERSFRKILQEHHRLIYSVVRGIVGPGDDTEDVVQEVFIKVFRALPGFRGEARLSTWIYRIARNEALNATGKRRPTAVPIEDCEDLAAAGDDPMAAHRKRLTRELLERLMEKLDETQRVALELRYMGDKSYEEIADIMDVPLGTVKTHIYRAKLSLKQMMAREGTRALEEGCGES